MIERASERRADKGGPQRMLTVMLVLISLSTVFLDYWEYSRSFHAEPEIWASTLRGESAAPAQYRIGVLKTADFLTRHGHMAMRHALALLDLIALLVAVFVLRKLLLRSAVWQRASSATQWVGAAAFLVLMQYALWWLTWYQRPETLTIAMLLALSLWFSTYRVMRGSAGIALTFMALVMLGLLQGWTRADVGFTFHLGVAIVCLTPKGRGMALPRWVQFAASLLAAGAAAGTQLFIMRVLYPQANYGTTPMFQLTLNWTDHLRIAPFVLFIAPACWLAWQGWKRRVALHGPQMGLLIGTAMFLGMWVVLGKIDEVRIFLPFAFALIPLIVATLMLRVEREASMVARRSTGQLDAGI